MHQGRTQYYSCRKAIPVLLKFRFSLLKYFLQKNKYPLFAIKSSHGGIIKTNEMQKKLKICKFVKYNNHYYFSLNVPHWPSDAFDNMAANGGLNITAAGTCYKKQIDTAIMGITRRCNYDCIHCYEHFNLNDIETVPVAKWQDVIRVLQKAGVSVITFSGGEPMLRYEGLLELLRTADHSLSDFHIHTSGYGVTPKNASELKSAGLHAAGVGLDDVNPERNDLFRGYKGAHEQAIRAIRCFKDAGIFTYVNFCPTKEIIRTGDISKYLEMLKDLNVGIVRWLEPKPCGSYQDMNDADLLSQEDKELLIKLYIKVNTAAEFKDYPLISYEAYSEAPGNMGCMMAGNSLLYIDSLGNVEPCVFLPVTFGNILDEDFKIILERMRKAVPKPLHTTCPSIQLNPVIRSKKENGIKLPVPYDELKKEFNALVSD
jgi:MoaA/NifB/PqqE/SkfB family radical SAM enzyme